MRIELDCIEKTKWERRGDALIKLIKINRSLSKFAKDAIIDKIELTIKENRLKKNYTFIKNMM